jgi:hypothetical protein
VFPYNIFAYCSICRVDCKFARKKNEFNKMLFPLKGHSGEELELPATVQPVLAWLVLQLHYYDRFEFPDASQRQRT